MSDIWKRKIETSKDLRDLDAAEFCLWWREEYPSAYFALGEACGLAEYRGGRIAETEHGTRSEERIEDVFHCLQSLVEIDPDGRR